MHIYIYIYIYSYMLSSQLASLSANESLEQIIKQQNNHYQFPYLVCIVAVITSVAIAIQNIHSLLANY